MHSCKYGTTGQYVLNLEVVLPTGEIIWTGANVLKNATGLNLTQLFVGSEEYWVSLPKLYTGYCQCLQGKLLCWLLLMT